MTYTAFFKLFSVDWRCEVQSPSVVVNCVPPVNCNHTQYCKWILNFKVKWILLFCQIYSPKHSEAWPILVPGCNSFTSRIFSTWELKAVMWKTISDPGWPKNRKDREFRGFPQFLSLLIAKSLAKEHPIIWICLDFCLTWGPRQASVHGVVWLDVGDVDRYQVLADLSPFHSATAGRCHVKYLSPKSANRNGTAC